MKERWRRDKKIGTSKERWMKEIGKGREQLGGKREMIKGDGRDRRQSKIQSKSPRSNLNVYHLN